ncbi:hypothetical protein MIMGU_mgv1a010503mg [Erythranthe guttata]|uniref:Uncharacterized protein n=1 Tax=Erythranthe guttata TaxID=4155 RepID=A0A022RV05_ERYGU|nr:hypothetical protein MIMGU_mgv1a010503mg [Erythranthe guttata]
MRCATNFSSSTKFVGLSQNPRKLISASSAFSNSPFSSSSTSLSLSRSFNFTSTAASFSMATPISVNVNASSTIGNTPILSARSEHHEELIKLGITPSLKGTQLSHKFPFVIFCAPPSGTLDYPGEVREATLNWNGEGSFVFTSSSAPYDCFDNGSCDENTPVVPIGRSPRTDKLLTSENVVLEAGGCVVRLAGLYISFFFLNIILTIELSTSNNENDLSKHRLNCHTK